MKKSIFSLFLLVLAFVSPQTSHAQNLVNLNFDSPITPLQQGAVSYSAALPGWTGKVSLFYNALSIGSEAVVLLGPGSGYSPLDGDYMVLFQAFDRADLPYFNGFPSLSQTGLVPTDSRALTFYAQGNIQVSFSGQQLTPVYLGTERGWSKYGCDMTSFAGQIGELRFVDSLGFTSLDGIQFSSLALVPEPGTGALVLLGLAALFGFHRFLAKS